MCCWFTSRALQSVGDGWRGCALSCKQAYTQSERQRPHRQLAPSSFKDIQSFLEGGGCTRRLLTSTVSKLRGLFPKCNSDCTESRAEAPHAAIRQTDLCKYFSFAPFSSPLFWALSIMWIFTFIAHTLNSMWAAMEPVFLHPLPSAHSTLQGWCLHSLH